MSRAPEHPLPAPPVPSRSVDALVEMLENFNWAGDTVEKCARVILSPNESLAEKAVALQDLKQLLCTTRTHVLPIAQEVIESGVLVGLVQLAGLGGGALAASGGGGVGVGLGAQVVVVGGDELKLLAAFCLTNIAAGSDEQTNAVVAAGAVPVMLELLVSPNEALRRQAIFCLANVAGSTPENRLLLAHSPTYVRSLKVAVLNTGDPRIEELAGWNLRNIVVLGGVPFDQCYEAMEIFVEQTTQCTPCTRVCVRMMTNGAATITSIQANSANWFKYGPAENQGIAGLMGHITNRMVLRFGAETFSHITRHSEGRHFALARGLIPPLLYLAKFSVQPQVRNCALEAVLNLASDTRIAPALINASAVCGLGELLADNYSYSPHQRALATRALTALATHASPAEACQFATPNVVARSAALEHRRALLQAAYQVLMASKKMSGGHTPEGFIDPDKLLVEYNATGGRQGGTPGGGLGLGVSSSSVNNNGSAGTTGGGVNIPPPPEDFDLGPIAEDIVSLGVETLETVSRGEISQSPLQIAHIVFTQRDGPEDLGLREKCGRLLIATLARSDPMMLKKFVSVSFIKLIVRICELASSVDVISATSSEIPPHASVQEALVLGEYCSPAGGSGGGEGSIGEGRCGEPGGGGSSSGGSPTFLRNALQLLSKIVNLGRDEGSMDNPVSAMLHSIGDTCVPRLEDAVAEGYMTQDSMIEAYKLIEKYVC